MRRARTSVYQHPNRFAAAIPTAGGFPPWRDASRIRDVPIWTFHGAADTVVPTDFTRYVFGKMKELGGNLKYTELRGVGHGANAIAIKYTGDNAEKGYITQYASDRPDKTSDVWDWLLKQDLSHRSRTRRFEPLLPLSSLALHGHASACTIIYKCGK